MVLNRADSISSVIRPLTLASLVPSFCLKRAVNSSDIIKYFAKVSLLITISWYAYLLYLVASFWNSI